MPQPRNPIQPGDLVWRKDDTSDVGRVVRTYRDRSLSGTIPDDIICVVAWRSGHQTETWSRYLAITTD